MKKRTDAEYYDQIFRTSAAYRTGKTWEPCYTFAAGRVVEGDRVLELGCGPGHLARRLLDGGLSHLDYLGVDFSEMALQLARDRCPEAFFEYGVLPHVIPTLLDWVPSVVILVEVLEHVEDDLGILEALPPGMRVLATVPTMDGTAHVRHFATEAQVLLRYEPLLSLSFIELRGLEEAPGLWWCFEATRRSAPAPGA